jgi:hypothetical protein
MDIMLGRQTPGHFKAVSFHAACCDKPAHEYRDF